MRRLSLCDMPSRPRNLCVAPLSRSRREDQLHDATSNQVVTVGSHLRHSPFRDATPTCTSNTDAMYLTEINGERMDPAIFGRCFIFKRALRFTLAARRSFPIAAAPRHAHVSGVFLSRYDIAETKNYQWSQPRPYHHRRSTRAVRCENARC